MAAKNGLEADTPPAFKRMLIMGNGGCGKTWLAHRISERLGFPAIHLDDMHWEPGHYGKARDTALRDDDVKAAAQADEWVMEGVYGQLVNMVLDRVTTLIWIDLPEEECIANIKERGIQGGGSDTRFRISSDGSQSTEPGRRTGIPSKLTRDYSMAMPAPSPC